MPLPEFWCLEMQFSNGNFIAIYGCEEVLHAAVEEWKSIKQQGDAIGEMYVTIEGVNGSVDRTPRKVVFKADDVISMSLLQYS